MNLPGAGHWIEGDHEDHGRVILTRRDGRFWCEAEEMGFVRGIGELAEG